MCDVADETCPIWRERELRARKAHSCMACDERIDPGHVYHRVDSMLDGQWESWVHCLRCWAIYEAIRNEAPLYEVLAIDPCLSCGEVWEHPPPAVAELAFLLPGERPPQLETESASETKGESDVE